MITVQIHPSFYDLDFGGVVNNIAYLRWMEDARTRFVDEGPLPLVRLMELRTLPVVRHTSVDYKLPLQVGDRAEMQVSLVEMRRSAWTMEFRFLRTRDGAEVVVAQQLCCFVHLDRMRPVGIPELIREYLERALAPE